WQERDPDSGAAAGPVRRPRPDRRPRPSFHREAGRRQWRLHQRRFLRAVGEGGGGHSKGPDAGGMGAAGGAGARRRVDGIPPRRVLASHGYAARPQSPGGALGERPRRLEGLELTTTPTREDGHGKSEIAGESKDEGKIGATADGPQGVAE